MATQIATLSILLTSWLSVSSSSLVGGKKDTSDVYYVTKMADRFLGVTERHREAVNTFSASEEDRLATAIANAHTAHDKSLLEAAASVNEEHRLESENALGEMRNFVTTLKQAMGAVGSAASCGDLTCGAHAYCTVDISYGARCSCKDGYQGNGFICKTPLHFTAHALVPFSAGQPRMQVADIHVSALQGDTVVVVYRSISNNHRGYALLGHATPNKMLWHAPVLFSSDSQAFSPVLVQLLEGDNAQHQGGIAIAFRDMNRGGDGILLGGRIDPTGGALKLGSPRAFTRHQAQDMSMLPLPGSRVVVIYSGHNLDGHGQRLPGGVMYGGALLAQVQSDGAPPQVIHKARFASGPVARLSAISLSPATFAVAYRQGQGSAAAQQAEAACITGRLHHNELIFDSEPLLLEPEQPQIWSRSMSLIGKDRIAYTYHSGHERVTKQAILKADPVAHHLEIVHGPEVIARGPTSVVGSVALVPDRLQADTRANRTRFLSLSERSRLHSSRLLTYFDRDSEPAQARLCSMDDLGIPSGCRDLSWGGHELVSASGAVVSDGRFVIAFTDTKGEPFYQLVGLSDPLVA